MAQASFPLLPAGDVWVFFGLRKPLAPEPQDDGMPVVKFRRPFRRGMVFPAIVGLAIGASAFAIMGNADQLLSTVVQSAKVETADSTDATNAESAEPTNAHEEADVSQPTSLGIRARVIDGDTIEDRDTGERIRLPNIDTPETGDRAQCRGEHEAGVAATRAAREVVAGGTVTLRRTGRTDQYGRTIGFVLVDGRDLGVILMERGLARPWRGRREAWCAADGSLLPAP